MWSLTTVSHPQGWGRCRAALFSEPQGMKPGDCWAESGPRGSKAESAEASGLPQPLLPSRVQCLGSASHLFISGLTSILYHSCPKCPGEAGEGPGEAALKTSEIWLSGRWCSVKGWTVHLHPPRQSDFQGRGRCPTHWAVCRGGKPLTSLNL